MLDAWLTFLTVDEPEKIMELIMAFPEFQEMYQDIYELCQNVEGVMSMFSKELQELDKNTVEYMIDEMQNEINRQNVIIEEDQVLLAEKDAQLTEKDQYIQHIHQLYSLLIKENRMEDFTRALSDKSFRDMLLKELA